MQKAAHKWSSRVRANRSADGKGAEIGSSEAIAPASSDGAAGLPPAGPARTSLVSGRFEREARRNLPSAGRFLRLGSHRLESRLNHGYFAGELGLSIVDGKYHINPIVDGRIKMVA